MCKSVKKTCEIFSKPLSRFIEYIKKKTMDPRTAGKSHEIEELFKQHIET